LGVFLTIFEPKIIKLNKGFVISANKTLAFLSKSEFKTKGKQVINDFYTTFDSNKLLNEGLLARADKDTLSITILPTMNCNLKCSYCFVDGGETKQKLSFNNSKYIIDQLIKEYPNIKKINVFFAGGGEPLLNFKLMAKIINYILKVGLMPTVRIVTNGTKILNHLN